jgi:hypothetical protein
LRSTIARLLLAASAAFHAGAAPAGDARSSAEDLAAWIARLETGKPKRGDEEPALLLALVRAAEESAASSDDPAAERALDELLLRLAARPAQGPHSIESRARELGHERLVVRVAAFGPGGATLGFLARDVIAAPGRPTEQRLAALELVGSFHGPSEVLAVAGATSDPDESVRRAAIQALSGFSEPAAHAVFLEFLERDFLALEPDTLRAAEHNLVGTALDQPTRARLAGIIAPRLLSADWREALLALELAQALPLAESGPWLVEALATWRSRGEVGSGSLRIEKEIVGVLQRASGQRIGRSPAAWAAWLQSSGGRADHPGAEAEPHTFAARFFELEVESDRVVFVIDNSGSMAQPWQEAPTGGTGAASPARTRFEEAVEQALAWLAASGEATRFGLVLFDDEAKSWRGELERADERTLQEARRWLASNGPQGGTNLLAGLRAALPAAGVAPPGAPGPARPRTAGRDLFDAHGTADTIVVLCDGETGSDDWVADWLAQFNTRARVRFDCVQIGEPAGQGGALEALAKLSGGSYSSPARR